MFVLLYRFLVIQNSNKIQIIFSIVTENGEDLQVLNYKIGQKYEPHYDFFSDKANIARGGHRVATVLMYLSDVTKGGETVFPAFEVRLINHSSLDLQ